MVKEQGQAMLLLILIMTVVGTVTVSVASRSLSGMRREEISNESAKAFGAAVAGLEKLLERNSPTTDVVSNTTYDTNSGYNAQRQITGGNGLVLI